MRTAVCYYSRHHGNTRKVLEAMAREGKIDLIDATVRQTVRLEDYDCVGFASGVYFGKFHTSVLHAARQYLPHGKPVFFVCTYGGGMGQSTRELKELEPIVAAYHAWRAAQASRADAEELLHDPDLRELAQEEFAAARAECERLERELTLLLLPKDPNDHRNVILEIRSGVGGEESALFAGTLLRMYTMYAQSRGWRCETVNLSETELGGVKECSVLIEGEGAFSRLKFESGVHRVQRVPETESGGRIHTSAATVAVLPEAEEVDVEIDPKDLQIDTYRSSGAGGQQDFVLGAYLSKGGKSFICCPATVKDKKSGELKSRIRPTLLEGSVVTATRTNLHWLVTEYGKFNAKGKSTWERAEGIISLAHPQFRDELIAQAEKMHIWRRSNKR